MDKYTIGTFVKVSSNLNGTIKNVIKDPVLHTNVFVIKTTDEQILKVNKTYLDQWN